jgi:hypothetical protein
MTNYEKLVETLRWTANEYKGSIMDEYDKDTMNAAADAIEKLVTLYEKAEMDATNLTGKLAQAEAQLPKRGEIVHCNECKYQSTCGYISEKPYGERADWFCADGERKVQE